MVPESIGKRIARLRQQRGWTQQIMADRVAISRVAVSHIEADLSIPSERTITLLASLFKLSPVSLVAGTTYPSGKADRLPTVVSWYTELELDLALMKNDMKWLDGIAYAEQRSEVAHELRSKWLPRLDGWLTKSLDQEEIELVAAARKSLKETCS